jgi:hypothetical protein
VSNVKTSPKPRRFRLLPSKQGVQNLILQFDTGCPFLVQNGAKSFQEGGQMRRTKNARTHCHSMRFSIFPSDSKRGGKVEFTLKAISSQVPLTTQPPFRLIINMLQLNYPLAFSHCAPQLCPAIVEKLPNGSDHLKEIIDFIEVMIS